MIDALLKPLIAIPSFSREEKQAADFLEACLRRQGLHPKRKGNNLWIESNTSHKTTILLNSHIDTVKPVEGWTRNPFEPTEENGKIYGLGSNDAGASLLALLQTYLQLTAEEQPNNFIFLASCEEEISGSGGIESLLPELPPIDLAIVGEPTGMNPAIAERGLLVLDAVVHGQSGHAARNDGLNAIYQAIPIIERLKNLRLPHASDLLGEVHIAVTTIQAGTQHNIIPDTCRFTVDVRGNEHYTNQQLLDLIAAHCHCEIHPRSLRLNPSRIDPQHPIVQRAKALGLRPFGSPTLSDQALMPFPSIKIGPGDSARSHTANEFIYRAEIETAVETYRQLLHQLKL